MKLCDLVLKLGYPKTGPKLRRKSESDGDAWNTFGEGSVSGRHLATWIRAQLPPDMEADPTSTVQRIGSWLVTHGLVWCWNERVPVSVYDPTLYRDPHAHHRAYRYTPEPAGHYALAHYLYYTHPRHHVHCCRKGDELVDDGTSDVSLSRTGSVSAEEVDAPLPDSAEYDFLARLQGGPVDADPFAFRDSEHVFYHIRVCVLSMTVSDAAAKFTIDYLRSILGSLDFLLQNPLYFYYSHGYKTQGLRIVRSPSWCHHLTSRQPYETNVLVGQWIREREMVIDVIRLMKAVTFEATHVEAGGKRAAVPAKFAIHSTIMDLPTATAPRRHRLLPFHYPALIRLPNGFFHRDGGPVQRERLSRRCRRSEWNPRRRVCQPM